jgi:hypothetical protein
MVLQRGDDQGRTGSDSQAAGSQGRVRAADPAVELL